MQMPQSYWLSYSCTSTCELVWWLIILLNADIIENRWIKRTLVRIRVNRLFALNYYEAIVDETAEGQIVKKIKSIHV